MKQKLKKTVNDFVESQQLNHKQLQELTKILNSRQENNKWTDSIRMGAVAVVFLLVMVLGIFWSIWEHNHADVSQLIAEEVSYNHLKMKPMEVASTSLNDMRDYFNELDFSLSQSQFVINNNLQLVGGRYCSIQGETAAQLRMKDALTGNIQIVYQAPYNKELFRELPNLQEGQEPVRHFVNGIGVDIWVEKGILFARSFDQ
tara:strand:- start:26598 stop:27203 length:606 start_codon:yes stop_codon:yes gene_type:complete